MEDSLVYRVSSRIAKATEKPCPDKNKKGKKVEKKTMQVKKNKPIGRVPPRPLFCSCLEFFP